MEEQNQKERNKILKGAGELFRKFGVRSITMDDLAHHMGISKKTIYLYFKDKNDIVKQAIQAFLKLEKERISAVEKSAKDAIHLMQLQNLSIKESFRDTNNSLLFDLQKYHSSAWKLIEEYRFGFMFETISKGIRWGMVDGLFRDDINVSILALMRLEQATLAHNDQIFPAHSYSLMEIQSQIFEHFIQGLLTDKGRKQFRKYKKEFTEIENSIIN
jgi:TetR/AcrR family transcriptional regulator, cholesterol catabolism regulator